jgi:hypothetical protein
MTEEIMAKRLKEVSDRRPNTLPKNKGMLVLDAFKSHLTQKA